jgi:hypothetical protein
VNGEVFAPIAAHYEAVDASSGRMNPLPDGIASPCGLFAMRFAAGLLRRATASPTFFPGAIPAPPRGQQARLLAVLRCAAAFWCASSGPRRGNRIEAA